MHTNRSFFFQNQALFSIFEKKKAAETYSRPVNVVNFLRTSTNSLFKINLPSKFQ